MSEKQNSKKLQFNGFDGIDARESNTGDKNIRDICNLRIQHDGSLKKRDGYVALCTASDDIRTIWSGSLNGTFCCFFLSLSSVYSLDIASKKTTLIGNISTTSGNAQFFFFRDALYLTDTSDIYRVSSEGVSSVTGYIPLYAKDWATTYAGEVNEPLNLFSPYARLTYKVPESHTAILETGLPVTSIVSVYKNGELLEESAYIPDFRYGSVTVPGIKEGDCLQVNVMYERDEKTNDFLSCPYAAVFGGISNSRLFVWGNKNESTIYTGAYVSNEGYEASKKVCPSCAPFYFPPDHSFVVGDGKYPVKALARHYDRLLIFTEGDVWMATDASRATDEFPVITINSSAGCASINGTVILGNDPITVGRRNIFRWTSETDELNECNAYDISGPIRQLLSDDFFGGAVVFLDVHKNEIWFHNPSVDDNAWIYNASKGAWTRFSNVKANQFFDANGEVGFIYGRTVYAFDPEESYDHGVKRIVGSLKTGVLDFGSSSKKKLSACKIKADFNYGFISISTLSNYLEQRKAQIYRGYGINYVKQRMHSKNFEYLSQLTIETDGSSKQSIYDVEVYAR